MMKNQYNRWSKNIFLTIVLCNLSACNNGSSSTSSGYSRVAGTAPIIVDNGPLPQTNPTQNIAYTTVTLCQPGTDNCQTIDHIQIDTGSSGFRIISSVLNSQLQLPLMYDSNGNNIVECMLYDGGYTWGNVAYADVKIGDEIAPNIPININGGSGFAIPKACSDYAVPPLQNTVAAFGANGLIGINPQLHDLESAIFTPPPTNGTGYYSCSLESCNYIILPDSQQVGNPVQHFAIDNNGELLQLPNIMNSAAESVTGLLTFGINTAANNILPQSANVFNTNAATEDTLLQSQFESKLYTAFVDSGTSYYQIPAKDLGIPECSKSSSGYGYLCPQSDIEISGVISSFNGSNPTIYSFMIANATTVFNQYPNAAAFPYLAGSLDGSNQVIWGLPFFYGKSVYLGLDQAQVVSGPSTPFAAYVEQ